MTIKTTILALAVGLTSLAVNGQSIKDYFISDATHNKASFYSPDKTGGRTNLTRTIYYIKKGTTYDITDVHMFNGKASSIQTMTVLFSANEVKMTNSISTTMAVTNKKQDYNPPKIIFKMPMAGQTATWSYTDFSGDNIKCTSSWTNVSIDGVQKKAIKVTKIISGAEDWGKTIEYYVKGIGLWKTDLQSSDGTTKTEDKFDGLSYDPTGK